MKALVINGITYQLVEVRPASTEENKGWASGLYIWIKRISPKLNHLNQQEGLAKIRDRDGYLVGDGDVYLLNDGEFQFALSRIGNVNDTNNKMNDTTDEQKIIERSTGVNMTKCQDCDREMSMACNARNDGWLFFGDSTAMCPICARLASLEKAVKDIQDIFVRAGVKLRTDVE